LAALNPMRALSTVANGGFRVAFVLGGVVLAVTGVEALYADMGHFGRSTISRAWHFVVLPSLILNYLGLAAITLRHPGAVREGSLFFRMVPPGIPTLLLVLLATLATIIASQALISGVFSLTAQARDLGLLPRFLVRHTSSARRGQVYLPVINWHLAAACLLLVVSFRSSGNLAAAYGLAVTGTKRSDSLPDVPTVAEFVPGYEAIVWDGIGAPARTPPDIVDKLNKEINAILVDPTIKGRFADLGSEPMVMTPAEFGQFVAAQTQKWGKVVKAAGIKPE